MEEFNLKLMKNLFFSAVVLFCNSVVGQNFNYVFNNPFLSAGSAAGLSIHILNDTIHVFGIIAVQDSLGTGNNIHLKYNLQGDLQEYQVWNPEDPALSANLGRWGGVGLFQSTDTTFFSLPYSEFVNFEENSNEGNYVQLIDQFGNETSRAEINWNPEGFNSRGARSISENEHLVYGVVWDEGGVDTESNNGFLLNCNSEGELNWVQRYDNTGNIRFMEKTPDGGFILGGYVWWAIGGEGGPNNIIDCVIIKTDSLGEEQWRYIFGGTEDEGYCPVLFHSNGDIYSISTDATIGPLRGPLWFQKIEDNGTNYEVLDSLQWSNPELFDHVPFGITEVSDGGIVGYGNGKEKWDDEIGDVPPSGFIYKVSPDLDSLWKRYYQHFIPEVDANHAFHDMVEGPDSCMYFTGRAARGEGTGLFDLGHIWLMKTDKYGCLEPDCHLLDQDSTDNIVQIIGLQNSLKVFPNPVRDRFTLEISLPLEFSPPSSSELRLLDMNGREVKHVELGHISLEHTVQIDVSDLSSGTYTLHWMNSGLWYDSMKVVVE